VQKIETILEKDAINFVAMNFLDWQVYRPFETFMAPFFNVVDSCVLRMTCKTLSKYIPKSSKSFVLAFAAMRYGYYHLTLWLIEKEPNIRFGGMYALFKRVDSPVEQDAQKTLISRFVLDHPESIRHLHTFAASKGNLYIIKWLKEKDIPWNEQTCAHAAGGGHLETLKWLHDNGCPCGKESFNDAAWNGHFEIVKWLHETLCKRGIEVCSHAALGGHLDVSDKYYFEMM
jgi:hypothetical protein